VVEHVQASGPTPARTRWRWGAALFLVAFVVFSATATRSGGHYDFWSGNYSSWHLVSSGTPWLDGEPIPELDGNPERAVWVQDPAPNGHTVIARSPGVVAAGLPAYWLAQADHMTLLPAALTAAALTALSLLFVFLALRTRLSERYALVATGALGFATPVWTISADGIWPHTITGMGIAGMAWGAATKRWWLVGLFGGVTLWGRLHAAIVVAVLGLLAGRAERRLRVVLLVAVPSTAFLAAQCAWSYWMYGSWSPLASYGGSGSVSGFTESHFSLSNHAGMWLAPDRGILVWSPIILVLLPALVRAWRELPGWSRGLLCGGLLYTLVQTSLITFTGGDYFYGQRLGLELVVSATPAFAFAARRAGPVAARLLGPVLAVQVLAMLLGALFPGLFLVESRVWVDNAFARVVWETSPAGPILVAIVAFLGVLAQRRWFSGAARHESPEPGPRSGLGAMLSPQATGR
jgi:alpha-1,2-mannosyltransferase